MKNLFIFTASGSKPKKHIEITVENPYRKEPFEQHIIDQELINKVKSEGDCYCWGNTSSGWTHGRWIDLKVGDYLLCYQDGYYTYLTQIIGKEHNKNFANLIWGSDFIRGKTVWWEYMYFFTKPEKINIFWKDLPEIRNTAKKDPYSGFTEILRGPENDIRISNIIDDFGSLETYFKQKLSVELSEYFNEDDDLDTDSEESGAPPPKYGSGGESERHKKLKLFIRDNPDVIEIENVVKSKDEQSYPTKDRVDVWFEDSNGKKYVVEIELEGDEKLLIGAKQLIKYRALEAVENGWYEKDSRVKAILVAYNTEGRKTDKFCDKYDIDRWQVDEESIIED